MFKNILVPVDGSEFGITQAKYAIDMAKLYAGKITALFVVDIKIVEGPLLRDLTFLSETVSNYEYHDEIKASLEEKGTEILNKVKAVCEEAGVSCDVKIIPGIVANTIADQARLSDLIVLGKRGENANFGGAFLGSVTEAAPRLSNKPVMVVDKDYRKIEKALFAYDGTPSSNKALQVFADFSVTAKLLPSVVTVDETDEDGKGLLDEAVSYLASYGLAPAEHLKKGDVVNSIISTAAEVGADAIMMGAYGHSSIHQMLLGSTTTLLMRAAKTPVILYR